MRRTTSSRSTWVPGDRKSKATSHTTVHYRHFWWQANTNNPPAGLALPTASWKHQQPPDHGKGNLPSHPPTLSPRPQDTEGGMDKWRDSNRALRIVSLGLYAAPAACCLHQPEKGQTEVGISRGAPPPAWFWFCLRLLRATLNHKKCPLWERLARGVCCRGSLTNRAIWALARATGRWYAGIARDTWKPTAAPS